MENTIENIKIERNNGMGHTYIVTGIVNGISVKAGTNESWIYDNRNEDCDTEQELEQYEYAIRAMEGLLEEQFEYNF